VIIEKNIFIGNKAFKTYLYMLLFLLGLFICILSSLSPFSSNLPLADSSVFIYIGNAMKHGQVPYRDVFDHKGPLLYLINSLGLSIGSFAGIWLIEVILMEVSIVFCYKTARLFVDTICSFLSTFILFILLSEFYDRGNYTEEYALPLIFISLYLFSKYFINEYAMTRLATYACGVCFGSVLMIRPNMVALWITFFGFIFFHAIFLRNYRLAGRYSLYFVSGAITVIIPFANYLCSNGAWNDFISQYIVFNLQYSSSNLRSRLEAFVIFSNVWLFGVAVVFYIYNLQLKKSISNHLLLYSLVSLFFISVNFALVCMSGRQYLHYRMTLIPGYLIPLMFSISCVQNIIKNIDKNQFKQFALIGIICMCFTINPLYKLIIGVYDDYKYFLKAQNKIYRINYDTEIDGIIADINKNTIPTDTITVYGNACSIYIASGRNSASKYIYQFPIAGYSSEIAHGYIHEIQTNMPKAIIITKLRENISGDSANFALMDNSMNELIADDYIQSIETANFILYYKKADS
jgi:hypothetical protein